MAKPADLTFLRQVLLFKDIADPELQAMWPWLRERRLRAGEVLFREGDPGSELFLIRSGSVVTPAGFEPAISTLKGSRPWPD